MIKSNILEVKNKKVWIWFPDVDRYYSYVTSINGAVVDSVLTGSHPNEPLGPLAGTIEPEKMNSKIRK